MLIAEVLDCEGFRLYESWVICKNLNMCDRDFIFLEIQKFKTSWVLFNHSRWRSAMAEGAGCWAYAAERPGFSIVEVFFIHLLCSRWKILAVPHISSAPRLGGHLVGMKQIWRRAPQIARWQDARYRQQFAPRNITSLCILWRNVVSARTWIHNRTTAWHRSPHGSHKLSSISCEQVVDPMLWRGPYYTTRCTGVRSRTMYPVISSWLYNQYFFEIDKFVDGK